MEAKQKLRTFEDIYNRLQWDAGLADGEEAWIGYEDRLVGPMEVRVSAFVPISAGGDLPMTRIFYVRRGDEVIWDRHRRLDLLFESGDTAAIRAAARGEKVKGFNADADKAAQTKTWETIARARANLADAEEERQRRLDQKQRAQKRKVQRKVVATAQAGEVSHVKEVAVAPGAAATAGALETARLRVVTWNVLCDDHIDDPALLLSVRAPHIAAVLCAAEADIIALQEVGAGVVEALGSGALQGFWRTDTLGELLVLSRHPIRRAFSLILGPHKHALFVEVIVGRRAIAVINVHLTSDRKGDESLDQSEKRVQQVRMVRAALATHMPHADVVLCGDFNEPGISGAEAVAPILTRLTDAWPSVHGKAVPGYTFVPTRNRLADLGSLNKAPRRLDRIFTSQRWRAEAMCLLGEESEKGGEASDHYGVSATLMLESALRCPSVHTSAVALLPPKDTWSQIDEIRKRFDPSYGRWMPHINLLYGFLPEQCFDEAGAIIEAVMRGHDVTEVHLEKLHLWEHPKSVSLVVLPDDSAAGSLGAMVQNLEAAFPTCTEQSRLGAYTPHLTLGKFDSPEEAHRWLAELQRTWRPLHFIMQDVVLLARGEATPFAARTRVPLGPVLSERDAAMLCRLEVLSGGTRAFALGSAALLGARRPPESDFDVLLVGSAPREEVFAVLEAATQPTWSRHAGGRFPLLQMELDGVHLDIQYARSSRPEHPACWPDACCEEGGCSAAALRDLHALQSHILEARGVSGWHRYQAALVRVKALVRRRGIGGNALGFLGGWSWSILLAATLLADDGDDDDGNKDGGDLVAAMWQRFAEWPWPRPVALPGACEEEGVAGGDALMPVMCPGDATVNSARNVTCATAAVLRSELKLLAATSAPAAYTLESLLGDFRTFVRCEVRVDIPELMVCAGWVEARLLCLVRSLEHMEVRPFKVAPGLWVFGIAAAPTLLEDAVGRFRALVEEGEWSDHIDVEVEDRGAAEAVLERRAGAAAAPAPRPAPQPLDAAGAPTLESLLQSPEEMRRFSNAAFQQHAVGGAVPPEAAVEITHALCRQLCGVAPNDAKVRACLEKVAQGGPIGAETMCTFLRAVIGAASRERKLDGAEPDAAPGNGHGC